MVIGRVFIVVLFTSLLFSCGGDASRDGSSGDKIFHFVQLDEPKRFDPAFIYDLYEGVTSGLLHAGLVQFGYGADIQPALAEKWDVSPDGKTYTFHLRDAKFSNGKPVTSQDVRYSFTRILRPETNSDRKWLFTRIAGADEVTSGITTDLKGLSTPDSRTVVITLKSAYPAFLTKLAMPNGAIIPDGSAGTDKPDKGYDDNPVGAGPWMLEKWLHDQRLEFRRNPHYWGKQPKLDRFIYHIQMDDTVQRRQFEAGNLDLYGVGFTIYPTWARDPKKSKLMQPVPELNTYYVGLMCSKPKLADKRVRQAIAYGINRQRIFEALQQQRGELAHGPVPRGIEGYRPELDPRPYDPERAKQLLAEAGVSGLTLTLWFRDESQTSEIMASVKNDLAKIGIQVNLMRRDLASSRQAMISGEADMFSNSWWLDYPHIENALVPTFNSANIPRAGNGAHYSNPEYDRLLAEADAEADPAEQLKKYQAAEDFIIEECPWIFLYHRTSYVVTQPWVTGYKPALMYNADRYLDVDIDLSQKRR